MNRRLEASAAGHALGTGAQIGSRLGPYRVIAWLGSGGMGDVYEVEHEELGRRFALKVLRSELNADRDVVSRFYRESRTVAKLVSDHIVVIVDAGALVDRTPYFVMERLYGSDLRRVLNEQRALPVTRVARWAVDACRGLACAHQAGLVHRDLKPENVFLSQRDDGQDVCKLLDFGIVKSGHENTTRPGELLGTTRYMAPEQIALDVPVGPQTDLFALAVIIYECLVGQNPFEGDTVERVLFKIMNERETPIVQLRPEVPQGLAELVSRALSKKPDERPESAKAFAEALQPYTQSAQNGPPAWQLRVWEGTPSDETERTFSTPRHGSTMPNSPANESVPQRSRRGFGLALLALGLGGGLGTLVTLQFTRSVRNEAPQPVALLPTSAGALPASAEAQAEPQNDAVRSAPPSTESSAVRVIRAASQDAPQAPRTSKPRSSPAAGTTKSAAPAASYDPRNPYAP